MPAGTGQSEPDVTEIRELEERLDNFRIQVSDDLTIRGNAWQGYALNVPECPGDVLGACCVGTECHIVTARQCAEIGGTFSGGPCDPNPCAITTCPTSVTFNGIEFCCACKDFEGAPGRVLFYEDPEFGVINGVPFNFFLSHFCDPFICINNSDLALPEHSTDTDDCPTVDDAFGVVPLTIAVRFVSGIWYVSVGILDIAYTVFYGFGADPSSISNIIMGCTLSPTTWDNPITQCFGGIITACDVGKNGTATLNF